MSEFGHKIYKTPEITSWNSSTQGTKHDTSLSLSSPADKILYLQRTVGNQKVQKLLESGVIQPKLKISKPNDKYEYEADRVAEQVIRMPEPQVLRQAEEEVLQVKEMPAQASKTTPNLEDRIDAIKGSGQPLPESMLAFFEPRFDYDFSGVRIHTDVEAHSLNQELESRAFTIGKDIFFQSGAYYPGSSSGRKLLAHELVHTIQQRDSHQSHRKMQAATIMRSPDIGDSELPRLFAQEIPAPIVKPLNGDIVAILYFGQDDFLMDAYSFKTLEQLVEVMCLSPDPTIWVDGHTSTEGPTDYNRALSEKRRQTVIAILGSKCYRKFDIRGEPHGEKGKTKEKSDDERRRNRRVEIMFVKPPKPKPSKKPVVLFPEMATLREILPETPEKTEPGFLEAPIAPPFVGPTVGELLKELPPIKAIREAAKTVAEKVDSGLERIGIPSILRDPIKEAIQNLPETAAKKALEELLKDPRLSDEARAIIRGGIKELLRYRP